MSFKLSAIATLIALGLILPATSQSFAAQAADLSDFVVLKDHKDKHKDKEDKEKKPKKPKGPSDSEPE
jgi:hypothetical protein